jgi:hypothetical protein
MDGIRRGTQIHILLLACTETTSLNCWECLGSCVWTTCQSAIDSYIATGSKERRIIAARSIRQPSVHRKWRHSVTILGNLQRNARG